MSLTHRTQESPLATGFTRSFLTQQRDVQISSRTIQESKISSPLSSSSEQSSPLTIPSNPKEKKLDAKNFSTIGGSLYRGASASSLSSRTNIQNIATATTIQPQTSIYPSSSCQIPTSSQIMGLSVSCQPLSTRNPLNTSRFYNNTNKAIPKQIQEEPDDSRLVWCGQDTSEKIYIAQGEAGEQQLTFEGIGDSTLGGKELQVSLTNNNNRQSATKTNPAESKTPSIFKQPMTLKEHSIEDSKDTNQEDVHLFFSHPPLVKLESILVSEHKGDQQLSMHDESSFLQALMQSSMLESAKINERGKGSFFLYPNTAKLTKRLLDLQEPRGNIEEEESETEDDAIQQSEDLSLMSSSNQLSPNSETRKDQQGVIPSSNTVIPCANNSNTKEEGVTTITTAGEVLTIEELELLNNMEEFSPHQRPPSMTSINNLQLNRDWSNSKQLKPLNLHSSISVDTNTTRGVSASEAHSNRRTSFSQQLKEKVSSLHNQPESTGSSHQESQPNNRDQPTNKPSNMKDYSKKSQTNNSKQAKIIKNCDQYENPSEKSASSYLSESIPDEPSKKEILETRSVLSRRVTYSRLTQPISGSSAPNDDYFIPELLRCFLSPQDHYSQLFHQYFQKMYSNYSIKLSIDSLYKQISPIRLPPIPSNKKTIFFDLDETLVHCIDIFTTPAQLASFTQSSLYVNKNNRHTFPLNTESCNETVCNIRYSSTEQIQILILIVKCFCLRKLTNNQCLISIRPYAQEMLEELSKDFELILLTAARQIYADAVLEKLDPSKKFFSHRFYRECCLEFHLPGQKSSSKNYLKDLRIFQNRRSENVILVDNSPLSFSNQINNGVPILDYCNNHKADTELKRLTLFLKSLAKVPDVREQIHKKFLLNDYKAFNNIERLQEYLQSEFTHYSN